MIDLLKHNKYLNRVCLLSFFYFLLILLSCVYKPAEIEPVPVILNIAIDTTIGPGDTLLMSIVLPEEDKYSYFWNFDDLRVDTTDNHYYTVFWPVSDTGEHTVIVGVLNQNMYIPETLLISVMVSKPEVEIDGLLETAVNDRAVFRVAGTDSDGFIEQYLWSIDKDGKFWYSDTADSFVVIWSISEHGKHTVRVKAIDDDGTISDIDSLQVYVALMTPLVSFVKSDTVIFINDSLLLKSTASDSNGTIAGYLWTIDEMEVKEKGDSLWVYWDLESVGKHVVTVCAVDDDSLKSGTDTLIIEVDAGFPVMVPLRDTVLSSFDSVKITCEAHDPDGEIVGYLWDLDGDGWDDTTQDAERLLFFTGDNVNQIIVGVIDDHGLLVSDTVVIMFNRPPEIEFKGFIYDTLTVGEQQFPVSYAFNVSLSDPDSDQVSLSLYTGRGDDTLVRSYLGDGDSVVALLDVPGVYRWRLVCEDSFGNRQEKEGKITVFKEYTICFAGHSIVTGACSNGTSGGFRAGVIKGIRDSLGTFERLRPNGPLTTMEMRDDPQEDSCLAVPGSTAKEMVMLLNAIPALSADIWVFMSGANAGFSVEELKNMISMIDDIYKRNTDSRIFVLNSPPFPDESRWNYYNAYALPDFNQKLSDTILSRKDSGYNIQMVDAYTLLSKDSLFDSTWFCDNVHPNQDGYDRLSNEILRVMYSSVPPVIPFKEAQPE